LSCEDDELHEISNAKAGIKSSKIKFNDFIKHTEAFNILTDVNNNQNVTNKNLSRSVTDTLNNFTIETEEGLYLQYANLHSFTFPIHREVDNGKLENIVLSYQNDGTYKVKILKYDLTAQEKSDLQNDRLKTIQNPIITIPLESFNTNLVLNSCGEYTETIYTSCSSGNHSFANGTGFDCSFWNLSGGTPPTVRTVTRYRCIDAGPSSGGSSNPPLDGGFGPNPTPGGGGGPSDNTYPIDYPTPDTNPVEYEEGISAPVKPSLNAPKTTPCAELTKLTSNLKMQNALLDLQTKTDLSKENGYSISKSNATNYNSPAPCNALPNNPNQIKMPTGGTIIGAFHTHPLASDNDVVPMFSDGDINWLFWVCKDNQAPMQGKVYEEFVLTLTVPQGTYAIKIKDWLKFVDFIQSDEWDRKDGNKKGELDELRDKYEDIGANGNHNRITNAFLEILRDFDAGIGLYEANSDLSGWSELELAPSASSNNEIEPRKKPCQ
jgi:hypothetical protein